MWAFLLPEPTEPITVRKPAPKNICKLTVQKKKKKREENPTAPDAGHFNHKCDISNSLIPFYQQSQATWPEIMSSLTETAERSAVSAG